VTRLALAVVLCWAAVARGETRRVAIVVGNNAGGADETALRYAEADAAKLARVLVELGGVGPGDLFLLQGRGVAELSEAFARARQRIASLRQDPASRVILVFYFSGHSDGVALELGRDRLLYSELRRSLGDTRADVRVAMVDSCKSGALLAAKGGSRGPAFQIRLTEDLASSGEVLLTSSAADEIALESREIGGSFFTHHLVSGLRGEADASGDGVVTLSEAYRYAYLHTIVTTGATLAGAQHPTYNFALSGQGELVLSELAKASASIELPSGFERGLVVDRVRDQVIAELTSDAHPVIAVLPGRYTVRAWRAGVLLAGPIAVAASERRAVRWDELSATEVVASRAKGAEPSEPRAVISVGGGATASVARQTGAAPSLRAELRLRSGFALALAASSTEQSGVRETASALLVGYRLGLVRGRFHPWAGLEVGGGIVTQTTMFGSGASGAAIIAPGAGLDATIARGVSLGLASSLPTSVLRRDRALTLVALPALWATASFDL